MKKTIIMSGILCLLISAQAHAEVSAQFIFGEPMPAYVAAPVYVMPPPVYPTYAVEGERYHAWHDHHHERHERHYRHDMHRH